MGKRLNPVVKLNKDIAEGLFGHRRGRPTLSRRAGGHIGDALNISADTGTDLFHLALAIGGAVLLGKATK